MLGSGYFTATVLKLDYLRVFSITPPQIDGKRQEGDGRKTRGKEVGKDDPLGEGKVREGEQRLQFRDNSHAFDRSLIMLQAYTLLLHAKKRRPRTLLILLFLLNLVFYHLLTFLFL